MRKLIILIMILGIPAFAGMNTLAQGRALSKTLVRGDSVFVAQINVLHGGFKWVRATLNNPSATLTDSVKIYHISDSYDSGKPNDTSQIGFKKFTTTSQGLQNDTVYSIVILAPKQTLDIWVWIPFPDAIEWVMCNAAYQATQSVRVKQRLFND